MPRAVEVEGLSQIREMVAALGKPEGTKAFKEVGYEIAAKIVVPGAAGRAATRMERRAAQTLKPVRTTLGGAVKFGSGFPAAMGAEFGADRNQRRLGRPHGKVANVRGWNQFKPWRGNGSGAGYFLWPTIRDEYDTIVDAWADGIMRLWDDLGGDG